MRRRSRLLWQFGPVMVADHRRDDSIAAIARRVLDHAPPRFSLLGLSMGGYIAFELLRQAPQRVARLALLDTSARPDAAVQSARRREMIELARAGRFGEIADLSYPLLVHADRLGDQALRELLRSMAQDTGAESLHPPADRDHESMRLATGSGCDRLPDAGAGGRCRSAHAAGTGAGDRRRAFAGARLTVVPASGHLSTLEQPQRVTAALVDWLGGP